MTDEMRWSCFFKSKAEALLMSRYYHTHGCLATTTPNDLVWFFLQFCMDTIWSAILLHDARPGTLLKPSNRLLEWHTPNSTNKEERTKALKIEPKNKHCFLHGEEAWLLGDDDFLMSFEKTAKKNRSLISEWNISKRKKEKSKTLPIKKIDFISVGLSTQKLESVLRSFSLCSLSSAEAS